MNLKRSGIKVLAVVLTLAMVLALIPGITLAAPDIQAVYDALVIPNADAIRGNVTLPAELDGAKITWTSGDETVVSTKETENDGYDPTPAGVVTRGENDQKVTLTAEIELGGETLEKTFDLTVKAKADVPKLTKYVMYYFKADYGNQERIWLAVSEDGLHWETLNFGNYIIESVLGEYGLRDPYILRSPEGDRFFLIATDLKVYSHPDPAWTDAQINGSKYIMVWESTDLVHWGEQRMVKVSNDNMGCTWAPEVTYDEETGEYVAYWASRPAGTTTQVVHYAKTRDFYTFTEPQVFITKNPNVGEVPVIDTTIIKTDEGYFRFTKDESPEGENAKRVFLEYSAELLGDYTLLPNNVYTDEQGVEGPEIYQLPDGRYCLILDNYGQGGYFPYVTDDLRSTTYTKLGKEEYSFPESPRHGGVMRITDEEYDRLVDWYGGSPADTKAPGSGLLAEYDFSDGGKDISGNGNDAYLRGNAKVTQEDGIGNVLELDGSDATFMELPTGMFDGRDELTVSMDINNAMTDGNYFDFTIGQGDHSYIFTKISPKDVKLAITTSSNGGEEIASFDYDYAGGFREYFLNTWHNITFTITPDEMRLYVDGDNRANADVTNTISMLGKGTRSFIGKSFWLADLYTKMKVANVKIYDYAMTEEEVGESITPERDYDRYSVEVDTDAKGADVNEDMFGLFFEDLNNAGDGGLYSEVINNRSFEAYDAAGNKLIPGYGWTAQEGATAEYLTENPLNNNNKTYLRLTAAAGTGVENDCYTGFSAHTGAVYNASVFARGDYDGEVSFKIVDGDGEVIGSGSFTAEPGEEFKKYEFEVAASGDCTAAKVQIILENAGTIDLDMVSMIPQNTFNGRDNGLRPDLVELLAELHPGFVRFPGGCIIEGKDLENRYQWKHTVGPVEQRIQNWNRWQLHNEYHEGNGMYGYCQTYGLGFYEYLLLCEDLGADAVPVLNVGLSCQYQDGQASTKQELYDIYIQDALDLIDFANGDPDADWESYDYSKVDTTKPETFGDNWANLRALMGHPDSFGLNTIGIGNEQWDTSNYANADDDGWANNGNNFFFRYEAFEEAIHQKAPEMRLIATSGPDSDGGNFDNAWNWLKSHNGEENFAYTVDEHYYRSPKWFYDNINRYDNYDRKNFDVFAGEYASRWWSGYPRGNTVESALSEAAYMTALERNSDVVRMASYAPLFAKLGGTQWSPDMIWFDTDKSYGSIDYYVQQLFSRHTGDYNVKTTVADKYDENDYSGRVGLGTWNSQVTYKDFKVTNDDTNEDITPDGWEWQEPPKKVEKYNYDIIEKTEEQVTATENNIAENIKDGKLETRWAADGGDDYLVLDLGEVKPVGRIGVACLYGKDRDYRYAIQTSVDGQTYKDVYDGSNGKANGDMVYHLTGNEDVRYVKILGKGNNVNKWSSITEVEINGYYDDTVVPDIPWKQSGEWIFNADGSITQTTALGGAYMFANEPIDAENYTISVTATKTDYAEGFLIPFMAKDRNNFYLWNIAGWGNTLSAVQQCVNGSNLSVIAPTQTATVIENDKPYEIKVEVRGSWVYGYLDGELITRFNTEKTDGPIYSNATVDNETGDIILKIVNSGNTEHSVPVTVKGEKQLTGSATSYVLAGEGFLDKNSIDEPEKVATVRTADVKLGLSGGSFDYVAPRYSVTVLRLHTGNTVAVESIGQLPSITVNVNGKPNLPGSVEVSLVDGSVERRSVEWIYPAEGAFANKGSFKIYGRVDGTELDAVIEVTVVDKLASEIIDVNTADILNGKAADVFFNPTEAGTYLGIVAVYGADNALQTVDTVEFIGTQGWIEANVGDITGKTVKIMLWTKDGLKPVTESVTIEQKEKD